MLIIYYVYVYIMYLLNILDVFLMTYETTAGLGSAPVLATPAPGVMTQTWMESTFPFPTEKVHIKTFQIISIKFALMFLNLKN